MSRENDWESLEEKGNWVTELVVLSSTVNSKLVVLTGGTLVLIKYLENLMLFLRRRILIIRTEVLFWSLSPQAACMTEASAFQQGLVLRS